MSALRHLYVNGELDLTRIADQIVLYNNKLKDSDDDISIAGKNLRMVLIEQNSLAAYYDEVKANVSTLRSYMELLKDEQAGKIYRRFSEDSTYSHNYNAIQQIIKADPDYIMYRRLELEFKELYDRAYGVCNLFQQRNFTLSNIIKVEEFSLQDLTLTEHHG